MTNLRMTVLVFWRGLTARRTPLPKLPVQVSEKLPPIEQVVSRARDTTKPRDRLTRE